MGCDAMRCRKHRVRIHPPVTDLRLPSHAIIDRIPAPVLVRQTLGAVPGFIAGQRRQGNATPRFTAASLYSSALADLQSAVYHAQLHPIRLVRVRRALTAHGEVVWDLGNELANSHLLRTAPRRHIPLGRARCLVHHQMPVSRPACRRPAVGVNPARVHADDEAVDLDASGNLLHNGASDNPPAVAWAQHAVILA